MERTALRRVTVDEDADALAARHLCVDRYGKIWHYLDFDYESLVAKGLKRPTQQWRLDAKRYWQRFGISGEEFCLRFSDSSNHLIWNVCSIFALYVLLWSCIQYGNNAAFRTACSSYLVAACVRTRAWLTARSCTHAEFVVSNRFPRLLLSGSEEHVHGFLTWLASLHHKEQ